MGSEGEDQQSPLLGIHPSYFDPEEPFQRTGTLWTAMAHVITGVIGAGVLSLAWSVAQLGWIAGPLMLIAFAGITILSTFILCDCYRSPDPEYGSTRNRSYTEAVKFYLGDKNQRWCGVFANESLYGVGITYNITAASSVSHKWFVLMAVNRHLLAAPGPGLAETNHAEYKPGPNKIGHGLGLVNREPILPTPLGNGKWEKGGLSATRPIIVAVECTDKFDNLLQRSQMDNREYDPSGYHDFITIFRIQGVILGTCERMRNVKYVQETWV